jgi:hypothetical protein
MAEWLLRSFAPRAANVEQAVGTELRGKTTAT